MILVLVLATQLYGMPIPSRPLSLLAFVSIATLACRAIGSTVAAVVNSSQEGQIVTQLIYMPMLLLSGATIPVSLLPHWLQTVTRFVPTTYIMNGVARILQRGETLFENWKSVIALAICTCVGLFVATKLFRWEKEEKLRAANKLWVLGVLVPFFLLGIYQAAVVKRQ